MSKTFMLIHGAWVTTKCWDNIRSFLEKQEHHVIVPAWPYMDRPVEELRANPDHRIAALTIKDLVDHFDNIIRTLPEKPVLVGHSFGGLIVQMLLDRGLGAAGVAIDAGPPRGVLPSPRAILSALPVLTTWRGWGKILTMPPKSFSATFANSLPEAEIPEVYKQQIVPAPGRIYFQAAIGIGNGVTFNSKIRPPLLLLAGLEDRTSTPSMVRAMYKKHSRASTRTAYKEFTGASHWLIADAGWQGVAEAIAAWSDLDG